MLVSFAKKRKPTPKTAKDRAFNDVVLCFFISEFINI